MRYDNDAKQMKFEVLLRVAQLAYAGDLEEKSDSIPYDIIPGRVARFRCCVYREREILRERVILARGKHLPTNPDGSGTVTVLPAACEGCPINRFTVTANCQRCMAKKCVAACPFGAITVTGSGAYIDPAKCKECGRCAAACPYNAISDTMRPCLRSCPVDAITMDENKQASIKYERCIGCGACTMDCPFGAISDTSSIVEVIEQLKGKKQVYAMFAPAIEGQFGAATVGMLKAALKKLGFDDSFEVALGADAVAQHEAHELKEAIQTGRKMTTSCCPAFFTMIKKHFPKLIPNISSTVSPMTATARYVKYLHPHALTVFIGPCIAKKQEIQHVKDSADYVLTFEELAAMFKAQNVDPMEMADDVQDGSVYGKGFAQSGGVGIIGKSNRQAGSGAQIIPHGKIMPVQIVGVAHEAAIHRAGAANTNTRYLLALCQLIAEGCNIIAHGLGRARQFGGGARFLYNSTVCIHKRSFDIGSTKVHTQIIHDCSLLYITFFSV